MGKAERNRQQRARESIARQQAAARKAETRRRAFIAGGSIVGVLAIVAVFLVVKALNKPAPAKVVSASTGVTATVVRKVTGVPAATLDSVGVGPTYPAKGSVYPHAIQRINPPGPPLTSGGKPQVVYVGAEYCPFCAAERWSLVVALSRFGTFSGLHFIHSSPTDTDPNTPTLSFYKASYTSKYLVFSATEAQTVTKAPLEPLTTLDKQLMGKYDVPPYVPSAQYSGSFPFIDFGNKYVIDGASYDPALLAGLSWQQIGAALANPSSTVAKAIDGAANHITAAICKITNDQPASVCKSAGVSAASGRI
jgi:thiol-disulfide isomerase/thioredoxin